MLSSPNTGVPKAGSTFTNAAANDHRYQMAPGYSSNDVLYLDEYTSGAAGAVRPSVTAQPASTNSYTPGSGVQFTVAAVGTAPITYRWQKVVNGTASNLSDGGHVSGSTTTNLLISPVSAAARLNIVSTLQDVTQPGDPISVYGGGQGGGAEGVTSAIDNTSQKYLNVSAPSAPFVGPVGFVVTPSLGATMLKGLRVYTANDAPDRDPADYVVEGSNDGTTFTTVASGALVNQEVDVANTRGFNTYRVSFNHVKNGTSNNLLQVGEVELLGAPYVQLSVTPLGNSQYQLQWSQGTLLEATSVKGPWVTNSAAYSPYTISPQPGVPQKYYRVQVQSLPFPPKAEGRAPRPQRLSGRDAFHRVPVLPAGWFGTPWNATRSVLPR